MTTVMAHTAPLTASKVDVRRDFDELYAASFKGLRSQLYAYLGDRQEAQDVVQEAFCRALARWKSISQYDDPVAWVRRVAWNLATSNFRHKRTAANFVRRQRSEHSDGPSPDRVALIAALSKISPHLRKAVVLHYIGQMSIAEIALQEDVAVGTVKSWLNRGRTALNEHMKGAQ